MWKITTNILILKSATKYVELKTELDDFMKIQQKLSGLENKLKKNDFTEFNELKGELAKVSINASLNGLKARKEILEKDLEKVKMLFGFISKEIKEIQKLNLGQTNFNLEFFLNIESFKLSYKLLFDKYPFIYYQIDEVMKNQKHVLPVIN